MCLQKNEYDFTSRDKEKVKLIEDNCKGLKEDCKRVIKHCEILLKDLDEYARLLAHEDVYASTRKYVKKSLIRL